MSKNQKVICIVLLILNTIVLVGQLWPEGAPPFARAVNVATLGLNLIFFIVFMRTSKS